MPSLPFKLTHDVLLRLLLGAPAEHKLPWWDGVELVVPEGAQAVWTRAAVWDVVTSLGEAAAASRASVPSFGPVAVLPLAGVGSAVLLKDPLGGLPVGVPAGARLLDLPSGDLAPRLNDTSVVSYTELFDLRLAFRTIDRWEAPARAAASPVRTALSHLAEQARDPNVRARGELDIRFGTDTDEARIIIADHAMAKARAEARPLPVYTGSAIFGFGTIRTPIASGRVFRKRQGPRAFVEACASVGVTHSRTIAAIAALESPTGRLARAPSLLSHRSEALKYWTARASEARAASKDPPNTL